MAQLWYGVLGKGDKRFESGQSRLGTRVWVMNKETFKYARGSTTADSCLISIGICTFRRPELFETLTSIGNQIVPDGYTIEVIVADNDDVARLGPKIAVAAQDTGLNIRYRCCVFCDSRERICFVGQHFWARGFFVNTVGRDEVAIRAYIRNQEKEDQRLDQLNLWR